ncbi:MAG: type II toxin-antitoxin system HicA family toxin [Alphaproteobacteria bacterium]|nr:type II toxin-antitoxin system HicA family toxin [Alphaproteobacteria bacterium]
MGSSFDRQVKKMLQEADCYFVRQGKGSHEIWHSPVTNIDVAVSHDIRSRHTANGILKAAGIKTKI